MKRQDPRSDPPRPDQLHPLVYEALAASFVWLVAAAWAIFIGSGASYLVFGVVTIFAAIAIGIPVEMWRIWRNSRDPARRRAAPSFRDWSRREIEAWQSRVRGKEAVIEALLPFVATAIAMTTFVIALHLTVK